MRIRAVHGDFAAFASSSSLCSSAGESLERAGRAWGRAEVSAHIMAERGMVKRIVSASMSAVATVLC